MRQEVLDIHGVTPVLHMVVVVAPADISAELVVVATEPIHPVIQVLQLEYPVPQALVVVEVVDIHLAVVLADLAQLL
jgi:hypothetical protein